MILIEKFFEVIDKTLELLGTIEEGILYVENQLLELKYQEGSIVIKDIMEGVCSIEKAIDPMIPLLVENNIESLTYELKQTIIKEINIDDHEGSKKIVKETLLAFKSWKEELIRVLKPYTFS